MDDIEKIDDFCKKYQDEKEYTNCLKDLKNISQHTTHLLNNTIQQYQENNDPKKSEYVEYELIRRFLNPSPFLQKKFTQIEGPISVYQMSHQKYPHIFYLYGDEHIKHSTCTNKYNIIDYIQDTIINLPVFIDIYLESAYIYKDKFNINPIDRGIGTYPYDIYMNFISCFKKDKYIKFKQKYPDPSSDSLRRSVQNLKACETSRFHYIDVRGTVDFIHQLKGFELIVNIARRDYKATKSDIFYIKLYIKYIIDINSFMNKRIQKQLDNIFDITLKSGLEKDYNRCLARYVPTLKRLVLASINNLSDYDLDQLIEYDTCRMDYYLLFRVFRSP